MARDGPGVKAPPSPGLAPPPGHRPRPLDTGPAPPRAQVRGAPCAWGSSGLGMGLSLSLSRGRCGVQSSPRNTGSSPLPPHTPRAYQANRICWAPQRPAGAGAEPVLRCGGPGWCLLRCSSTKGGVLPFPYSGVTVLGSCSTQTN